jgi:predicted MPP superfamily phosphohydrolase
LLEASLAGGKRIEVTRHALTAPVARPLTLALLADLHITGPDPALEEMVAIVEAERPDVIVLAGDVGGGLPVDQARYLGVLRALHAPRGIFMVPGNWDYWTPTMDLRTVCARANVRLLVNEAVELAPNVWLAGLDDDVEGTPDPEAALRCVPAGAWTVALVHCPVGFDAIAGRCALALAGHTHGGQIRAPLLPPLWLPAGSGRYVSGWYEQRGSRLYVSRGIASTAIPVRTFCRPEIALFTLRPENGAGR